jgi:serine/threonine protein kinase
MSQRAARVARGDMSERDAGAQTFGRYRLLEPITKGGMAEVWRAKLVGAENFERPMVIKRILPHLCDDPAFVKMFISEARLSARLHHPNIVQVFELGDVDGELFMALEHISGVDLATLMTAAQAPLPPGLCALVAHEVARALAYAHAVSDDDGKPLAIVHRDVSPSNIMLGYDGQVRLCDFGIAKALGVHVERSRTGGLKGKLSYMAPEVFDGAPFDQRSDLFAVGVVMHEILTGRRLFRSDDELETMALVRACNVPPPSQTNPAIPPQLERVVLRALARDPAARQANAEELANELRPIVHALQWGAPEVTALLAQLTPATSLPEPSVTVAALRRSPTSRATPPPPARRVTTWRPQSQSPRWRVLAIAAGIGLAAGTVLVLTMTSTHKPSPPPAPLSAAPAPPNKPVATPNTPGATPTPVVTPLAPPPLPAPEPPPTAAHAAHGTHPTKKHKHKRALDIEHGDLMDKL